MSLPPALLKRLANRGIVNSKKQKSVPGKEPDKEDEIEDPSVYEQHYEPIRKQKENVWIERMKSRLMLEDNALLGYKGCPNKYNIYHKCTTFCVKRWGDGIKRPTEKYLTRQKRLLKKYPLPKHWKEVYEHGFGIHYYWNSKDDTVAWLPPLHPKSSIGKSAATLRRELEETDESRDHQEEKDLPTISDAQLDEIFNIQRDRGKKRSTSPNLEHLSKIAKSRDSDRNSSKRRDEKDKGREREKDRTDDRDRHRRREYHKKKLLAQDEPLDPMDPASYSDCPRGKWSDGLIADEENTATDLFESGLQPNDVSKLNGKKIEESEDEANLDRD